MNYTYLDGFDAYPNVSDLTLTNRWPGSLISGAILGTGRNGYKLAFEHSTSANSPYLRRPIGGQTEFQTGVAYQRTVTAATQQHHIITMHPEHLSGGPTSSFFVSVSDDGLVVLMDGDAVNIEQVVAVSSKSVGLGGWNYIESYFKWGDADPVTGGKCKVWMNGELIIDYAGNTKGRGGQIAVPSWARIQFGGAGTFLDRWKMDDIYMGIPVPDTPVPLGDSRIHTFLPTDESSSDFTLIGETNYATALGDDSDASFVQSDTPLDEVLVSSTDTFDNPPAVVHVVALSARAKKMNAGPRSLVGLIGAAAAHEPHGTEVFLSQDFDASQWVFNENPDTVAAWVPADFVGLTFGVRVVT